MNTNAAQIGQTRSGCLRVWLWKRPRQIEITNSSRRTAIFQLDAWKAPTWKRGWEVKLWSLLRSGSGHCHCQCIITWLLGIEEEILEVNKRLYCTWWCLIIAAFQSFESVTLPGSIPVRTVNHTTGGNGRQLARQPPWAWSSMRSNLPPTKLARVV